MFLTFLYFYERILAFLHSVNTVLSYHLIFYVLYKNRGVLLWIMNLGNCFRALVGLDCNNNFWKKKSEGEGEFHTHGISDLLKDYI